MVYPLVAIPAWIVSRYFYNWAGKAARYLLVPLLVAYAVYKVVAFAIARATGGQASLLFGSYRELPHLHQVFLDTVLFLLMILGIFGIFFLVARHAVRKTLRAVSPGGSPHYSPAESSQNSIKAVLAGKERPPMDPAFDPTTADVFVSGHTHLPSLAETKRPDGSRAVLVNSGCFCGSCVAHNAPAKGAADLRFEVRPDPRQSVRAGGAVARRALGAAEAGRTDPDPYRAPRFDRAPAAAAAQRGQASPRGFRHLVAGRAACLGQNVRVYMNSTTLESIARDPEGRRWLIRSWTSNS